MRKFYFYILLFVFLQLLFFGVALSNATLISAQYDCAFIDVNGSFTPTNNTNITQLFGGYGSGCTGGYLAHDWDSGDLTTTSGLWWNFNTTAGTCTGNPYRTLLVSGADWLNIKYWDGSQWQSNNSSILRIQGCCGVYYTQDWINEFQSRVTAEGITVRNSSIQGYPSDPGSGCLSPPDPPPPCETEYDQLTSDCQDTQYIKEFDYELCEGSCYSCEEIESDIFPLECATLGQVPGSFTCTHTIDEGLVVSIDALAYTCNDMENCTDYMTWCSNYCGSVDNIQTGVSCVNGVVTVPCDCISNPADSPVDPDDYEPGNDPPAENDDPDSQESDGTDTDNEALNKIVTNTGATADNTSNINDKMGTVADNTKATADNIKQLAQDLGDKLDSNKRSINAMGSDLEDIEGYAKQIADSVEENKMTSGDIEGVYDGLSSVGSDALDDAKTDFLDTITTAIDDNQPASDSLDSFEDKVESLLGSESSCVPIDLSWQDHELILGCDIADKIKALMSWIMGIGTVLTVFSLVYNDLKPKE